MSTGNIGWYDILGRPQLPGRAVVMRRMRVSVFATIGFSCTVVTVAVLFGFLPWYAMIPFIATLALNQLFIRNAFSSRDRRFELFDLVLAWFVSLAGLVVLLPFGAGLVMCYVPYVVWVIGATFFRLPTNKRVYY